MMKRLVIIGLMITATLTAAAQKGMHADALFEGRIVSLERMVETKVRGKALSRYGLTLFHSLRFTATKEEQQRIEALIGQDMEQNSPATMKRVGKSTVTITIQLPPQKGNKRLFSYKCTAGKVLVIYLEGPNAVAETIGKLSK